LASFAHLSDIHIGAFRQPLLQELALKSFTRAMEICIERPVDFIIVSGDLFDSNIPDMALANAAVRKIREVTKRGIPFYVVYGSHDFSPTQTSIVDLIESAGLFKKVTKGKMNDGKLQLEFQVDERTGAKLCGISGRRLGIEKEYYNILDRIALEKEGGFKIFVMHGAVSEYKPKYAAESESIPLSSLPRGFSYYAGGHIHEKLLSNEYGYSLAYPGTPFGADYRDLETTARGQERGFFIVNFANEVEKIEFVPISICDYELIEYDANGKTAAKVQEDLLKLAEKDERLSERLLLLRVSGEMSGGKTSEIDFQRIRRALRDHSALEVLLNYQRLTSKEYSAVRVAGLGEEVQRIEERLFRENIGTVKVSDPRLKGDSGIRISRDLLAALKQAKKENETKGSHEARIISAAVDTLGLKEALQE
jgi:exonuclease SbcD